MEIHKFWKAWSKQDATVYKILLLIFILCGVAFVIFYYTGIDLAYDWQINNNIKPIPAPLKEVKVGLLSFFIEGVNYLNLQEYTAGLSGNFVGPAIFLISVFFISLSAILTAATHMNRFWFFVVMALMIFLFLSLRLDNLLLFGKADRTGLIVALILFIGPSYYFHAINQKINTTQRLLFMLAASALFLTLIVGFAEAEYPVLAFANYALIPPVIIAILFIIIVAHEIIAFFLYVITINNNEFSKNSDIHFSVITILYLLALLFTHLVNTRFISWDLIYLNPFLILLLSAAYGIWGFAKKRGLYENILRFEPYGAILYLAMGMITFGVIAYLFITGNDPVIESFEDIILFTHIGYGVIFFIYVLANFFTLLHNNERVFVVVYKPTRMPYFTAQLAGLIATLAFFFQSGQVSLDQARSGFYNAEADYYYQVGNYEMAKELYRQGAIFGFNNHHSNFGLASIYRQEDDPARAAYFFHQATRRKPTEYAFINLSEVYSRNDSYFESLFTLQDGMKIFPSSGVLANNLALRYNRINAVDSALYFIAAAREDQRTAEKALANEFGIYAANNILPDATTLKEEYSQTDNLEYKTHLLLLLNQYIENVAAPSPTLLTGDSTLTINEYAFLQNYILNQIENLDSIDVKGIAKFVEKAGSFFAPPLSELMAFASYEQGRVIDALDELNRLMNESTDKKDYYSVLLASIALNEWEPQIAVNYLGEINEAADTLGRIAGLRSIAGFMLADRDLVDSATLRLEDVHPFSEIRQGMRLFAEDLTDSSTFFYVGMNRESLTPNDIINMSANLTDRALAAELMTFLVNIYIEEGNAANARLFLEALREMHSERMGSIVNKAELKILYHEENYNRLFELFNENGVANPADSLLYRALEEKFSDQPEAREKFIQLASMNPFFEEGVIEAAKYFSNEEDLLSYRILQNAIQYNDSSPDLYKAYIVVSLENGLTSYADDAMERLRELTDAEDYAAFKNRTDSIKTHLYDGW